MESLHRHQITAIIKSAETLLGDRPLTDAQRGNIRNIVIFGRNALSIYDKHAVDHKDPDQLQNLLSIDGYRNLSSIRVTLGYDLGVYGHYHEGLNSWQRELIAEMFRNVDDLLLWITGSTSDLIKEARSIGDAEEVRLMDILTTLHLRGTNDVYDAAMTLCHDSDPHTRCLGIDILSQWALPERTREDEILSTLIDMFHEEKDNEVIASLCVANSHRKSRKLAELISTLADHTDDEIRHSVVFGLMGQSDDKSVQTLIILTNDDQATTRDWATFALGSQIDVDTPAIRDALYARVLDVNAVIRGEAFVGLARRHDGRVVDALIDELAYEKGKELAVTHIVEAADEIHDSRLYTSLVKLRDKMNWEYDDYTKRELDELIESLKSETKEN